MFVHVSIIPAKSENMRKQYVNVEKKRFINLSWGRDAFSNTITKYLRKFLIGLSFNNSLFLL